MKYAALLALTNAIKINDKETSSQTPASLAETGPELEALAQVETGV